MPNSKLFPTVLVLGLLVGSTSPYADKKQNILTQASSALNEVAKKATPAVVSITSIRNFQLSKATAIPNLPPELSDEPNDSNDPLMMGIGSGVIISPDGLILTNDHVVQNAQSVKVTLSESNQKESAPLIAHVVGSDPKTDLAVLRLDKPPNKHLPTLAFGNSELIQVGDWSIAIGSPFGLNKTVTSGIVSAVGRARLGMLDIEDFIQTDAAINPGSSGGPLLNVEGQIIGINTAIYSQSGGFIGIGLAIPSKIVKQITSDIIQYGHVVRGWVGMTAQDLDENLAKYFKVSSPQGALISQITPRSPAEKASLKIGDVITKFGGTSIESADHLKSLVGNLRAKTDIPLEVYRDGTKKEVNITVLEQESTRTLKPAQLAGQRGTHAPKKTPHLGLSLEDIPVELSVLLSIPIRSGAFVTEVKVGSPAFQGGIYPGDIILKANKQDIHTARELREVIRQIENTEIAVFYLQRGPEQKIFVPVKTRVS